VWCAIFEFGLWRVRIFFEEDDVTATVTSDQYCAMLENCLRPKVDDLLDQHGADNVWFQQDGATAHTSRRSLGILREMFPGHAVPSPCVETLGGSAFAIFDPVRFFSLGLRQSPGIPTSSPNSGRS
jgi:hypothetical protein